MIGQAGGLGGATAAAIGALKEGKDVAEASGWEGMAADVPEEGDEADTSPEAPTQEVEAPEESSSEEDSEQEAPASKAKKAEDIEEIILTDETGRKKLKVDWNDREKLKKYVQMAHGARKWQSERDAAKSALARIEPEYKELKETYTALDQAWRKDGEAGIINLLSGNPKAYESMEQKIAAKYEFLKSASPEQKKLYDLEQQYASEKRERERLAQEQKEFMSKMQADREAVQAKEVESIVYPAFEKYRFKGKLGDETTEHHLDQAIWTQTLARLEQLPEESINSSVIDSEFRKVAATFGKVIGQQANEKAKKVVESKKVQAKEAASTAATKGMKRTESSGDVKDKIVKGDLRSAFMDMIGGKKL